MIALSLALTLVIHNHKELRLVEALQLKDWKNTDGGIVSNEGVLD